MTQTAIEWLHEIAKQREPDKFDWKQAKEMEKQQIMDTYRESAEDWSELSRKTINKLSEQYYNKTFKQD
jgi:hypothetical protein